MLARGNNTTFLLELEKRRLKYLGGFAKNRKVIIETETNNREEIRLDKLAESLSVEAFPPIQLNLDKPKIVWVATLEVELSRQEGTRAYKTDCTRKWKSSIEQRLAFLADGWG